MEMKLAWFENRRGPNSEAGNKRVLNPDELSGPSSGCKSLQEQWYFLNVVPESHATIC